MSASFDFKTRVMPVVVIDDAELAVPLSEALLEGGIDAIEITLRHACALDAIARVAKAVPKMVVGAGTITRPEDFTRVLDAGSRFALSPGFTPALSVAARAAGMPFIPGVMTPSEVIAAREEGYTLMKLFPAQQAGGMGMLKALGGPLADVKFCPTGGVTPETMKDFLKLPNVAMIGGSWLTPADALKAKDWKKIVQLAREATELAASV